MAKLNSSPDFLPGTLEMLILKTLSRGTNHGWGIAQHIQQVSGEALKVGEGSLYPALQRLLLNESVSECRNSTSVLRSHAGLQLSSGQVSHLPPGASLRIKKAVITAAGQSQRALPLQTLIDRDGQEKPVLCILIEQALAANVEEICVVVWPGDEARYADAAGRHASSVRFVPQPAPKGYGDAILCAREFTGADAFLHMVGDHLYVSAGPEPSTHRLVALAEAAECSVSGVQPTRESLLPRFGTVAGRRVEGRSDLYRIDTVIEKPTPTEAEQRLMVPGIRAGYYLCFFGIHVLTPAVMELLEKGAPTLSAAVGELARHEQSLALEDEGRRYDLGARYGLLVAQLALALNGQDRAQVLSQMLELLADRGQIGSQAC